MKLYATRTEKRRIKQAELRYGQLIIVEDGRVINLHTGDSVALAGARATVETVGSLTHRLAPARLLAFGILGASKKVDTRQTYLTIEGTDGGFVHSIDPRIPKWQAQAREFAVKLNALAQT